MAAICLTTAVAPLTANAQTSPTGGTTTIRTSDDRDNDTDYGWIGLLGLLGLAGLMRKKPDVHRHDTTKE